jgi:dihydropteroate synthase
MEMHWKLRSRELKLGERTLVMGVVNITPDSFSDGGLYLEPAQAIEHALRLLDEGADLLDLGAESTRPGSHAGDPKAAAVSAEEEQARLLPVLEGLLRARPDAIVSIDTYKAASARVALAAGAEIINDVSGLNWDSEMAGVCAEAGCGVVLMHTRGRPDEWREQPRLAPEAVMSMVREGLSSSLETSLAVGIRPESVVLDPGYGFGKRLEENYALLARQAELLSFGRPLLAGLSRKSFLARTLEKATNRYIDEDSRDTASVAALTAAILHGASIVRVHRVRAAVEAAAIADAALRAVYTGNAIAEDEKSP